MPTRALLGMRNILLTNTKGTIVMNSLVVGPACRYSAAAAAKRRTD